MFNLSFHLFKQTILSYLSVTPPPKNNFVASYVGKTIKEITSRHKDFSIFYTDKTNIHRYILEIRLDRETLACEMYNGICIEAYSFSDSEPIFCLNNPCDLKN